MQLHLRGSPPSGGGTSKTGRFHGNLRPYWFGEDRQVGEVPLRYGTWLVPTPVLFSSHFCSVPATWLCPYYLLHLESQVSPSTQSPKPQTSRSSHLLLSALPPKYHSILSPSFHLHLLDSKLFPLTQDSSFFVDPFLLISPSLPTPIHSPHTVSAL